MIYESAYVDDDVSIGNGTKIWHFSHVLDRCRIGKEVVIGQNVVIGPDVTVGDRCKIQNNVSLYKGVSLDEGVFCGPSCVFTNVNNPRAEIERKSEFRPTLVRRGATIGANATIVCGVTLGEYCFVAAGAVGTKDAPPFALMAGVPARRVGWMSYSGDRLGPDLVCPRSGRRYRVVGNDCLEEAVRRVPVQIYCCLGQGRNARSQTWMRPPSTFFWPQQTVNSRDLTRCGSEAITAHPGGSAIARYVRHKWRTMQIAHSRTTSFSEGCMSVLEQTKASTRQVPFFNYQALFEQDRAGLSQVILDVCGRGAYIMQRDLREFEESLAKFTGAKHAIGVSDGTNAILLGLRALELPIGSEVIMASHTYVATANSAYFAGLVPVPVECGSDHMIDPASIEEAITPRTRVIMPTQLNGRCADMDAIAALAKKHNLIVAEDAAQALGARFNGVHAGLFGAFGTISFYPAKVLGCFGDGGAVLTNDDKVADFVRMSRDHGRNDDGEFVMWGTNARLDNLHAAVLNYKLKTYEDVMARRRWIASHYEARLSDLGELELPPQPDADPRRFDIFQNYEIEAERRDQLKEYLKDHGIGSIIQWGGSRCTGSKRLGLAVCCRRRIVCSIAALCFRFTWR